MDYHNHYRNSPASSDRRSFSPAPESLPREMQIRHEQIQRLGSEIELVRKEARKRRIEGFSAMHLWYKLERDVAKESYKRELAEQQLEAATFKR